MKPALAQLLEIVSGGGSLHKKLAQGLVGRRLRCSKCGAEQLPTEQQMADYFRIGWPVCCGETMALEGGSR